MRKATISRKTAETEINDANSALLMLSGVVSMVAKLTLSLV